MTSRREFLTSAGVSALTLGFAPEALARLVAREDELTFGALEPLVARMEESEPDALVEYVVRELRGGVPLERFVAAGALANARTFGGEDYTGYHAFMALMPALAMASELSPDRAALPVLKVLHRNTAHIRAVGGEVLKGVEPGDATKLHEASRAGSADAGEAALATLAGRSLPGAFEALQPLVRDDYEVHRVVLAQRAWETIEVAGVENATTLLRQVVRFCAGEESRRKGRSQEMRRIVPQLVADIPDRVLAVDFAVRPADAEWIDALATRIFRGSRAAGAEAAAAAIADGVDPFGVCEALSLASTRLVLHDPGRSKGSPGKPVGSVHGASVGVHASDSALAWREIARECRPREAVATLVAGAYHTAGQAGGSRDEPLAHAGTSAPFEGKSDAAVLAEVSAAVAEGDQARACAAGYAYAARGADWTPLFDVLIENAIANDGALHAEKYFHTAREVARLSRRPYRAEHLAALARVAASQTGFPAPGVARAAELLSG